MIVQTAKEFLINSLNSLSVFFPEIHIRYEIRNNKNIVEVIPISVFENDEIYLKTEQLLEKEFERLFPNEDIIFISEDSLTKIKNAEYEFGKNKISFDAGVLIPDIIDNGYSTIYAGETNYALAA